MSLLNTTFNVTELPESNNNFDPLPAGWYQVNIKGAELKDTKAGTGQYIAVQYDVTGPTHQGRVVFGNINIRNPNPKAEEIGHQQLGELMRSIGLPSLQDTDQLIGGSLSIKLSIRKSEEYGDSNDVKGFKALEGAITQAPAQASPQVATASAAPWAKG
jgi:hypothetical protein